LKLDQKAKDSTEQNDVSAQLVKKPHDDYRPSVTFIS